MFVKRLIALLLLCACATAAAQTGPPVDGIYWNPQQGGRGYSVETQDDIVFIAIYNYDQDHSTAFYFVQGTWDGFNRRVADAHLYTVDSGPWVGSPFSPHGPVVDLGSVAFEFPTFTSGRFVYNGQTVNLQRFLYGYGPSADSLMQGIWQATSGDFGVYFGDVIPEKGEIDPRQVTWGRAMDMNDRFLRKCIVGLGGKAMHRVADVSYGEQRRVELAIGLAQAPRLLLLDEPLAGLSQDERTVVQRLIAQVPRETAILMIEHDMDVALEFAEQITVLHYGKVLVEGDRKTVVEHPKTREIYLGH
jgi:hypothetical protein